MRNINYKNDELYLLIAESQTASFFLFSFFQILFPLTDIKVSEKIN